MAKSVQKLTLIPQGWFFTWYMAAMTGFQDRVILQDSSTTYVDATSPGGSGNVSLLAQGNGKVIGTGLTLTVESPDAKPIQVAVTPATVFSPSGSGQMIAAGYTLCYEDASDNDFNDVFVSIMAWQKSN